MNNLLKTINLKINQVTPTVAIVVAMLAFWVIWSGGEYMVQKFSALEVRHPKKVKNPTKAINPKDFYAIWIEERNIKKSTEGDIAKIFTQEENSISKPMQAPGITIDNTLNAFRQLEIKGVADDGAFIGQHFYQVGQPILEIPIEVDFGQIFIPILLALGDDTATFDVGGKKVILPLHAQGSEWKSVKTPQNGRKSLSMPTH